MAALLDVFNRRPATFRPLGTTVLEQFCAVFRPLTDTLNKRYTRSRTIFTAVGFGRAPELGTLRRGGGGHTPNSAASVPTAITRRFETVDAVVLVDSAKQPMQAAPVAVMRALVSSGNVA